MTRFGDIQARHAKATPGPWERDPWEADAEGAVLWNIPANDWEFIAACPDDVGWLLNRVTQLETDIHAAMNELGVPGVGYPAPVANAHEILALALRDEVGQDGPK